MKRILGLCSVLLLLCPVAIGQVCEDPDMTTIQMQACQGRYYDAADKELNMAYKNLMRQLPPQEKRDLITSEKAWLRFRDLECQFQSNRYAGGSLKPVVRLECLRKLTEERTQHLHAILTDLEYR